MAHTDLALLLWLNSWVGEFAALDSLAEWAVSDYLVPVALALTLVVVWFVGDDAAARLKHQIGVMVALSAMGVASLTVLVINSVYFRPRPFIVEDVQLLFYRPTDSSFPANSAANDFAIAAAVWGVNRKLGAALFLLACVHGLARVYAGVHYPSDIVVGALIGLVMAWLAFRLRNLLEPLPTMFIKAARILCLA